MIFCWTSFDVFLFRFILTGPSAGKNTRESMPTRVPDVMNLILHTQLVISCAKFAISPIFKVNQSVSI